MCGHHDTVFDTQEEMIIRGAISVIETAKSVKRTLEKFNIIPNRIKVYNFKFRGQNCKDLTR